MQKCCSPVARILSTPDFKDLRAEVSKLPALRSDELAQRARCDPNGVQHPHVGEPPFGAELVDRRSADVEPGRYLPDGQQRTC